MNYLEMYNNILESLDKVKGNKGDKFNELFLLICLLIYNLSCNGKQLDRILILLNEFDYNKNFKNFFEEE